MARSTVKIDGDPYPVRGMVELDGEGGGGGSESDKSTGLVD